MMKSMNATVQTKLRQIVAQYGISVIDDPLRCQGLLNDLCPMCKREVNSLILVLKEGVPLELIKAGGSTPRKAVASRLIRQIVDNHGLSEDVARWAVESWSRAVDSLDPAEIAKARAAVPKVRVATPAPVVAKAPAKTKAIKPSTTGWKTLSDTIQHQAVLLPVALFVVSGVYLLLLSPVYGAKAVATVLVILSGSVAIISFVVWYPRMRRKNNPVAKAAAQPPAPPAKPRP
jgi:hypothetical protein